MTKANRFKLPSLYKRLMAVIIVIGPIYWLMLTEDGRRRTDLVVLYLAGEPTVELRLDTLAPAASEERFREFVPDVEWQCENTRTPLGERTCMSPIGSFNGTPAHYMVLYYEENALQAMKVAYRDDYHDWLTAQLGRMLGQPASGENGVLQWSTGNGLVLMQEELPPDSEKPTLMWLSAEQARKRTAAMNRP